MTIRVKHLEGLESCLAAAGVEAEAWCVVGSAILARLGVRENRDIDIVVTAAARRALALPDHAVAMGDGVEVVGKGWAARVGISDDELVRDGRYFQEVEGVRMARPEILFAIYQFRKQEKDLVSRRALAAVIPQLAQRSQWDWELVRHCLVSASKTGAKGTSGMGRLRKLCNPRWVLKGVKGRAKRLIKRGLQSVPEQVGRLLVQHLPVGKAVALAPPVPDASLRTVLSLQMATGTLLGLQYLDGEFCRYDVLLRSLTAASIAEGRDDFEPIYQEMQRRRLGESHYGRFKELVQSVRERGLLPEYPIPISEEGRVLDGAHRLACALYFGIPEVHVKVMPGRPRIAYGRGWFEAQEFAGDLLERMEEARERLSEQTGAWFPLMLWPPAEPFFDEICGWVRKHYRVCREVTVEWGDLFPEAVKRVYQTDDIELWKVELKLHCMRPFGTKVRLLALELPDPAYRSKADTGLPLSTVGEKIKGSIRSAYKDRISGYFHDIICHTGDNPVQNREIFSIIREMEARSLASADHSDSQTPC